jgi:hypothetical protein
LREVAVTDILDDSYESDLTDEEHERLILMSEHAIAKPLSTEARKVFEAFNRRVRAGLRMAYLARSSTPSPLLFVLLHFTFTPKKRKRAAAALTP